MAKAKALFPSDTIALKISTGGNSAGNGGDGVNTGDISSKPSIEFNPYNKAEGADVHVNTGDKVHQDADWDAGGANAKAEKHSKAEGGKAKSNGDQESDSGHNKSDVDANTKAYQTNEVKADINQTCGPASAARAETTTRRKVVTFTSRPASSPRPTR